MKRRCCDDQSRRWNNCAWIFVTLGSERRIYLDRRDGVASPSALTDLRAGRQGSLLCRDGGAQVISFVIVPSLSYRPAESLRASGRLSGQEGPVRNATYNGGFFDKGMRVREACQKPVISPPFPHSPGRLDSSSRSPAISYRRGWRLLIDFLEGEPWTRSGGRGTQRCHAPSGVGGASCTSSWVIRSLT